MADDLYSIMQQIDPQTLQKMVEAGLFSERSVPLHQQLGIGQGMMDTPAAQGRNVGNTYVASSPLEHLSNAIRQVVGARIAGQAMQGESGLADTRGQGRLAYLKLLAQRAGQPAAAAPQGPPDPYAGID